MYIYLWHYQNEAKAIITLPEQGISPPLCWRTSTLIFAENYLKINGIITASPRPGLTVCFFFTNLYLFIFLIFLLVPMFTSFLCIFSALCRVPSRFLRSLYKFSQIFPQTSTFLPLPIDPCALGSFWQERSSFVSGFQAHFGEKLALSQQLGGFLGASASKLSASGNSRLSSPRRLDRLRWWWEGWCGGGHGRRCRINLRWDYRWRESKG